MPRPLGDRSFQCRPQTKAVPNPGINMEFRWYLLLLILQVELGHALTDIGLVLVAPGDERERRMWAHVQAATVARIEQHLKRRSVAEPAYWVARR